MSYVTYYKSISITQIIRKLNLFNNSSRKCLKIYEINFKFFKKL